MTEQAHSYQSGEAGTVPSDTFPTDIINPGLQWKNDMAEKEDCMGTPKTRPR